MMPKDRANNDWLPNLQNALEYMQAFPRWALPDLDGLASHRLVGLNRGHLL